jgi:hypothetical protein
LGLERSACIQTDSLGQPNMRSDQVKRPKAVGELLAEGLPVD